MKKTGKKRLQELYPKMEDFIAVSNNFNLSSAWGYPNPKSAWYENPMIQLAKHISEYKKVQ